MSESKLKETIRTGEWLFTRVYHVSTDLIEGDTAETLSCSRCGFEHKFAEAYGWSCVWKWCPNCGAKMTGCEKDVTHRCDGCQYHAPEGYCRYFSGCPYKDN